MHLSRLKTLCLTPALSLLPLASQAQSAEAPLHIESPDGHLSAEFYLNNDGAPRYEIKRDDAIVLRESKLGLVRDDADFSKGLALLDAPAATAVEDHYQLLTAKRRLNDYHAKRRVFHLATKDGKKLDIIFQVSDDGVAFRYYFPETSEQVHSLTADVSSFHFHPETKAWLQAMQVAKSGWVHTNPAYEEFYEKEIPVGTPSPLKEGWVYPALFRTGDTWLAVSEGSLPRTWCASHLSHESPDGEYGISFPDARQTMYGEPVNPASTLPWLSPWRFLAIGSLKTITESTLGTDLAEPAAVDVPSGDIKPGKASWSWPLLGDRSANFDTQKQFIDYAADMDWEYCLIDALWDKQIGYEKMQELADYARSKDVGILLWYNSNGDWNGAPQTPKNKLLTHEARVAEFTRLKQMGIKGLKVDFFAGDGRPVIDFYHDLLEDAASFGLLMNFHGATLPRGWQRTYPNLMTVEAIRGLESITFEQKNADQEPAHAATLPFTRNLFDPMDFTPMVLDKLPHNKQRRTTSAFELALSVLFTSGIQHYAEIPAGMAKAPEYVRDFLRHVPSIWEDTVFLDGFPGKYVVLARKGEGRWYVCGINGESTPKTLELDLSELSLPIQATATIINDGEEDSLGFATRRTNLPAGQKLKLTLKPTGGFVIVLE